MRLKSISTLGNWKTTDVASCLGLFLILHILWPSSGLGRIYIDINAPSIQRIQVAVPDFRGLSGRETQKDLAGALPEIVANDLDMSGYFTPMDKAAFLEDPDDGVPFDRREVSLKNWSVIGAELLVRGGYSVIGRSLELEIRLYDVFRGRLIMGKRFLGRLDDHRALMHRVSEEIVLQVTGRRAMFLSKLAFVGTMTGSKEIYTCDYDGHNVKQVTSDKSIALFPRWSPSGDKIVYNSYKEGGPMLYLKDLKSGKATRISGRKGLNIGAVWATDGKSLALTLSHGDNPEIYTIDLKGKILARLTNHWSIDVSPSFSPDGGKFAFVSNRSGNPQIYVRDLKEGTEERITFTGKYNTSPSWSSLNRIAFAGMSDGFFDIYSMNSDGSDLRKLTEGQGNNEDPCWSPDGRYIAFSSNREGGYQLYLMNASGQNQRRISYLKGEQTCPSWSSTKP